MARFHDDGPVSEPLAPRGPGPGCAGTCTRLTPSFGCTLVASDPITWWGFPLQYQRSRARGRMAGPLHGEPRLVMCLDGHASVRIRLDGRDYRYRFLPRLLSILPGGGALESLCWSGTHDVLVVDVGGDFLARLARHDSLSTPLVPQHGVADPHVAALLENMLSEINDGCPGGRIYAESLSLALGAHLHARYGRHPGNVWMPAATLTRHQQRKLSDHIQTHLADDLSLPALAATVSLSTHHFARLFKNAFGMTPHRYVLTERVREGRRLLEDRSMPIVDVATASGFASQSHFTQVFHRLTGTTPSRYRRGH